MQIKNGGFGLGELRELQEFHVDGDVQVEEEAVDLWKDEVEKGLVSFDTCSVEGYVASIHAMCDDAENVKGKMEVAINQFKVMLSLLFLRDTKAYSTDLQLVIKANRTTMLVRLVQKVVRMYQAMM
ncbi:hypothetical protein Hanom_Chr01g00002681 [Helianthus anomalus]